MRKLWQSLNIAYKILRILSIDVALGAVAMAYLWAVFLEVAPSPSIYAALGLVVWLIYTLDHLLDASQIQHLAHTPRHRFHQKYFKLLCGAVLLVAVGIVVLLSLLEWSVWLGGSAVLVWVVLHFLLSFFFRQQHYFLLQKELRIAIGYSLGVAVGVISTTASTKIDALSTCWLGLYVVGLAWFNLLLIAYYEHEVDIKDGHHSLAVSLGLSFLSQLLIVLSVSLVMYFLLGVYFLGERLSFPLLLLLGLMVFTLEMVRRFEPYFQQKERYRTWADAIFLYPAVWWVVDYF